MTRALVVGRRRKGRSIGEAVDRTRVLLEAGGWTVESATVTTKRAVRRRTKGAVKARFDVVVAVGGDGAVLQVVQALGGTPVALGIIPKGTGNLLAGNLGIPKPLEEAAGVLLSGGRRRIDLGRVTVGGRRRLFAVACGIGFDADVMAATGTKEKRRVGRLAYVASAIGQAGKVHNASHELVLDGVRSTLDATQVFVANFGGVGKAVETSLPVLPDDGLLDVIAVEGSGPLAGLLAGLEALRQTVMGESPEGHAFRAQARAIRIAAKPRRLVETDGSVVGTTPVKVSVRPAALTVIIPAGEP